MGELKSRGIIDDLLNKLSIESPMYIEPTKRATNIVDEEKLIQAEIVEKGLVLSLINVYLLKTIFGKFTTYN